MEKTFQTDLRSQDVAQRREPQAASYVPMPIIVGAPRSGTTLLRFMLDSHPDVAIPPETGFLGLPVTWWKRLSPRHALFRTVTGLPSGDGPWRDFGLETAEFREELQKIEPFSWTEGLRCFYRLYARKHGKIRYGDKTPLYCQRMRSIERLLPESHFIHLIRDGRDVALSLRSTWFAPGQDMKTLGLYWRRVVNHAREEARGCQAYMEVRYEDLVSDPLPSLRSICGFLKLEFHPAMLRYWERTAERLGEHGDYFRSNRRILVTRDQRLWQQRHVLEPPRSERASCWKREMSLAEQSDFLRFAGKALREFGYEDEEPV